MAGKLEQYHANMEVMAVVPGRQAAGRCRSPPTLDAGSPECFYDRRVVKAGQVTGSRTEHAGSEVK